MIIAFVPCTKTSNAGARHLYKGGKLNLSRYYEGLCGKALFLAVWAADCEKVVIENPTPSKILTIRSLRRQSSPMSTGIPTARKRCCGSAACRRCIRQTSWSLRQHGARPAPTRTSTVSSTRECLPLIVQRTGQKLLRAWQRRWLNSGVKRMITCCHNCTSHHTACHDTCEKYKAEKKDFEERKAFVYELNHSQSVYRRDYEDKHRERGKKRFLGSEFRGER